MGTPRSYAPIETVLVSSEVHEPSGCEAEFDMGHTKTFKVVPVRQGDQNDNAYETGNGQGEARDMNAGPQPHVAGVRALAHSAKGQLVVFTGHNMPASVTRLVRQGVVHVKTISGHGASAKRTIVFNFHPSSTQNRK